MQKERSTQVLIKSCWLSIHIKTLLFTILLLSWNTAKQPPVAAPDMHAPRRTQVQEASARSRRRHVAAPHTTSQPRTARVHPRRRCCVRLAARGRGASRCLPRCHRPCSATASARRADRRQEALRRQIGARDSERLHSQSVVTWCCSHRQSPEVD